jgi:nucleoside-diphosphate-sugar epimerase
LAEKVARITGYDVDKVVLGLYPPGYPLRPIASDQPYLVLNLSKIRRHGWEPKVSLDEGLRKVVE